MLILQVAVLAVFLQLGASAQPAATQYRIAFYNVENLFDLEDDPNTFDEDFTPAGKNKWTADRYQSKLSNIAKIMDSLDMPDIIGLCEVENRKVLEALAKTGNMASGGYDIAHFDSPDGRGIDVALLYKRDRMKLVKAAYIRIPFPDDIRKDYTSRDILRVEGRLASGETLHLFVNHWPSRSGGVWDSQPRRLQVARYLKTEVEAILQKDASANIVIMGDFNDEPLDYSVSRVLGALPMTAQVLPGLLYNAMSEADKAKEGTYVYEYKWNMLDQFIVSSGLRGNQGLRMQSAKIFRPDWIMYQAKSGPVPNRTYGGTRYYGGYSDHLPIYLDLERPVEITPGG